MDSAACPHNSSCILCMDTCWFALIFDRRDLYKYSVIHVVALLHDVMYCVPPGAMILICDMNEYRRVIKDFKVCAHRKPSVYNVCVYMCTCIWSLLVSVL